VAFESAGVAGTYLRSFAHDLGEILGCGAHLFSLRRIAAGPFCVDGALTPEELAALGPGSVSRVTPMEEIPLGLPTLVLTPAGTQAIRHGRRAALTRWRRPARPCLRVAAG